jgi:membrane protein YqaA with SNARE-associated domain
MLRRLVEFIQPFAASLGGPGLLLVAVLDSSFIPLPEVPDLLLVWFVVQHPSRWLYYAGMTTLGSVIGCYTLYSIFRKGGEAMLRRRFKPERLERGLGVIRRYGLLAVLIPAILPPPAPFKIFVILAGASGIPVRRFLMAVILGRGFRYFAEALLAYHYGSSAMAYISENLGPLSFSVAAVVAVLGAVYIVWRRRSRRPQAGSSVEN